MPLDSPWPRGGRQATCQDETPGPGRSTQTQKTTAAPQQEARRVYNVALTSMKTSQTSGALGSRERGQVQSSCVRTGHPGSRTELAPGFSPTRQG